MSNKCNRTQKHMILRMVVLPCRPYGAICPYQVHQYVSYN
uniref:Uncharacterized protein n=1 Tax=Arundo donax TaxID=35708 RepID=A0A0A9EJE0_ARUDO